MTPPTTADSAGTKTVLVIDEDPNGLRLLAGVLDDAGYRAVVACGAEDAWRKLARQRFDVALVELAMKQVSGIRMIEMMRNSPLVRGMPVLAVTMPVRRSLARQIGCDGFVFRPIHAADLVRSVQRVCATHLDSARRVREGRRHEPDSAPQHGDRETTPEATPPVPTSLGRRFRKPSRREGK